MPQAKRRAFTLIELLVVIAIIGLLAVIALISLNHARANARDAKRLADMKQMQTALALYYDSAGHYPSNEEIQSGKLSYFSPSTNTTTFMEVIPSAPMPADGPCSSADTAYSYNAPSDGSTYTINFCISKKNGDLPAGNLVAWSGGINGGAASNGNGSCTPDCSGKVCGDDGCDGVCGYCTGTQSCVSGNCECTPNCSGMDCGDADGCGGYCSGGCGYNYACQYQGGNGYGYNNGYSCVWSPCTPNCGATGHDRGDDGCGGYCGSCYGNSTCDSGNCVCHPDCGSYTCGDNDGCGGSCGTCLGSDTCAGGTCCTPNCSGRTCGPDGCGGICGSGCSAGNYCQENIYSCAVTPSCLDQPNSLGQYYNGLGYDSCSMRSIGSSYSLTSSNVEMPTIGVDSAGTLYVAYGDFAYGTYTDKLVVQKRVGTSWSTVGTAPVSSGAIEYPSLSFDGTTPYVAYSDYGFSGKLIVKRYNGSSWVNIGSATGISSGTANNVNLILDGSTPYVAFTDESLSGKATVIKYNGTSWVNVGSAGFSPGRSTTLRLAIDNHIPYVAFLDNSNAVKAEVMKFDGSSWTNVGPIGFTPSVYSGAMDFAIDGGTPYLIYNYASKYLMRFNGSTWENVGPAYSTSDTNYLSLAFNNGTPYISYFESGKSYSLPWIKKFDGSSWQSISSVGSANPEPTSIYQKLVISNGQLYLSYQGGQGSNSSKINVYQFSRN